MIITRLQSVPTSWVWMMAVPFATFIFANQLFGVTMTFSIKKFTDNPALIAFIISLQSLLHFLVGPLVAYLSDRIWTRFGRRKPFVVTGWCIAVLCMPLIPFAPNIFVLVGIFMVLLLGVELSVPYQPLQQEAIPVPLRGRATAAQNFLLQIVLLVFYGVLIGRFDDVYFMGPLAGLVTLTGEVVLWWSGALFVLPVVLFIALGIREMEPPQRADIRAEMAGKSFFRTFFKGFFIDVFSKQFLPLYLIQFAGVLFGIGLGTLAPLLYTDQWGYTKQEYGGNVALGTVINIVLSLGIISIADRFDKMKLYRFCLFSCLALNAAYYLFVTFLLPDQRPTLWQIVLFGEMMAVFGILAGAVVLPLMFEYVPRDEMGAAAAGMGIMQGASKILVLNGIGLWVSFYSYLFHPHAGSMVRVVLDEPADRVAIERMLPDGARLSRSDFYVKPWFPPGQAGEAGRLWTIRQADPDAEKLAKERVQQESVVSRARQEIDGRKARGRLVDDALQRRFDESQARVAVLSADLDARARGLRDRMSASFASALVEDGAQLIRCESDGTRIDMVLATVDEVTAKKASALRDMLQGADYANVRVEPAPGGRGLSIGVERTARAALAQTAVDEGIQRRLAEMASGHEDLCAELYRRVVKAAAAPPVFITVAAPFPVVGYAPQEYNYFSAYILTILGGCLGIFITFLLTSMERRGVIQKLGVKEYEKLKALEKQEGRT